MNSPLLAIARKEFIQIRRDRATIYMVFIFPLMMLILYGFGIRYDVKSVPIAVWDRDRSLESRQYIERFAHSPYFQITRYSENYEDIRIQVDRGLARIAIVIPENFGERIRARRETTIQTIVDGSDNNTSTIALNYISTITRNYSSAILMSQLEGLIRQTQLSVPPLQLEPRIWFNPDMESVQFIVPGIIAIIMMIIGSVLTAVTIVKEKEQGTIEQIVSSPVKRYELMIGKVIPYAVLAYMDFLIIIVASRFIFGVSIKGSLPLLMIIGFFYLIGVLGIGVVISTVTETQISAMLAAILLSMLPSILLSGFIFPINQMPAFLQAVTFIVPARHFIEILRDIYLKGLGLEVFWKEAIFVAVFGFAMIGLAVRRFHKRLD